MGSVRWLTRKQIVETLKNSEEQFAKVFGRSPLVVTITSAKNDRYIEVNETFERTTGWRRDEVIGRTPDDLGIWVDPGQRADIVKRLLLGATFQNVKVRVRMRNGDMRTGLGSVELIEVEGEPCVLSVAMHSDAIDVTEVSQAENALSKVSQRLIEAQEEERTRIGRELRDYIDNLAVLSINLDGFRQNPLESVAESRQKIEEARQQVKDIARGIYAASHFLNPLRLEYLGLAAAAASFCKEFSAREKVEIDFHCEGIPNELPKKISLCLYRVLQEILQATKHSGSRPLEVSLSGEPNEIRLTVRDWGIGFDPGLMRERLKLVDGELSIESRPHQRGTTVHAPVPIRS